MAKHHVTCINKLEHHNRHEHITHIGNSAGGWRITREDAIRRIDSGTDSFYTIDIATEKHCAILVVREHGKDPYLRSHADGKPNDNLLEQEECSESCVIGTLGGGGLAGHRPHIGSGFTSTPSRRVTVARSLAMWCITPCPWIFSCIAGWCNPTLKKSLHSARRNCATDFHHGKINATARTGGNLFVRLLCSPASRGWVKLTW